MDDARKWRVENYNLEKRLRKVQLLGRQPTI